MLSGVHAHAHACMHAHARTHTHTHTHTPGLKLGWVIQVITFCPGQAGLTQFIKYPGLTQILHWITCVKQWRLVLNLSVLGDDGCISPDPIQDTWKG